MLKTSGHVKTHWKACCIIYEDFKNRKGVDATLDAFKAAIEKHAAPLLVEEQHAFKGDMLEIFAEIFFKAFQNDPRVGLSDYTPVPLEEDYGVDGYGKNAAGKQCAVQIKYRANPLDSVTYAELSRTYTSAMLLQQIPLEGDDCLYVFTTAYDVTSPNGVVFKKMLRVISHKVISQEVDSNVNFWDHAFEEIKETLLK